ncbi:hypothetical protein N836_10005 [Leptolyngbya sp. Heron Island J]|uniref:hypothetical protein n=1 Tax=Leptolyngbya sp. Heron Island J TaxID=1385935 RepID=UPI0003B9D7F2|nr:hypothetical protein [Leptolyngbya sp. Heron Island J]ESA35852.1 hypothetical protein N836_10005 [Leptolyngbya sp. Heron Island J]
MDSPDWINNTTVADNIVVEIGFLIASSFYTGPENDFTPEQWETAREPLYSPNVERYGDFILSGVVAEDVPELVAYYKDVLRLADLHGKDCDQQGHYFWMRPLVLQRGLFAMTFPWYDTMSETDSFLQQIKATDDGQIFWDIDQGWEMEAFALGDWLYLRESNPDENEDHFLIKCNKKQLQSQLDPLLSQIGNILRKLRYEVGADYWSTR